MYGCDEIFTLVIVGLGTSFLILYGIAEAIINKIKERRR